MFNQKDIAFVLLESGADPHLKNAQGSISLFFNRIFLPLTFFPPARHLRRICPGLCSGNFGVSTEGKNEAEIVAYSVIGTKNDGEHLCTVVAVFQLFCCFLLLKLLKDARQHVNSVMLCFTELQRSNFLK